MTGNRTTYKAVNARAGQVGRRVDPVKGYLLMHQGTAGSHGAFCRNLDEVERRLQEIEQEQTAHREAL